MVYPKIASGIGLAALLTLSTIQPSVAAPVSTGALALKNSVARDVVDVRWRGRGWGWGGAGFATGLAFGALAARPYYYSPYYYAPPPVYYAPPPPPVVYSAPTYVEPVPDPNGPARQCWVPTDKDRGFGYYAPC